MIRYDESERRGWDVGTRPDRIDVQGHHPAAQGPGMRWDLDNAEAMMALEALHQSRQWDRYWERAVWQELTAARKFGHTPFGPDNGGHYPIGRNDRTMHDLWSFHTGRIRMATYIVLLNFTTQGVAKIRDTAKRAAGFRSMAEKVGVTVKEIYWTLGGYDGALILEADDDRTVAALLLAVAAAGNVRTQLLRAFDTTEIAAVLAKVPKGGKA